MTDEIKLKPTFTQCLLHETKFAYIPYFKWLAAFVIVSLIIAGVYVIITVFPYEQFEQYMKLLPWYVYAVLLVLSPPFVFSCIECTRRRIYRQSAQLSGLILIVIACLIIVFGFVFGAFSLIVMGLVCGTVGFWLL